MRHAWKFLTMAALAAAAIALLTGVVMWLWNAVVPPVFFGAREIDYWQALGLLVLSRILFGGFRGKPHGPWWHHRHHPMHGQDMTPEERERFHHHQRRPWPPRGPCRDDRRDGRRDEAGVDPRTESRTDSRPPSDEPRGA